MPNYKLSENVYAFNISVYRDVANRRSRINKGRLRPDDIDDVTAAGLTVCPR
jgi:hypothetical protein